MNSMGSGNPVKEPETGRKTMSECSKFQRGFGVFLLMFCLIFTGNPPAFAEEEEGDPAEIGIGERLFLETRFAQFFFDMSQGDANHQLEFGDPALEETETTGDPLPGPFAGQSMNCRACHLVDEQLEESGGGMRTYTDFARRSPIPARPVEDGGDGATHAPRNSPPLVNASLERPEGLILHFDGEFPTMEDLVKGTLTGRNYGWLVFESNQAIAHVAHIIRNDDGTGDLAKEFGGSYKEVLRGNPRDAGGNLMTELVLPTELQLDVDDPEVTDEDIFNRVADLIAIYTLDLAFGQDENGAFNLSPYDVFLEKNGLNRQPAEGESNQDYTRRWLDEIEALTTIEYVVDPDDGSFNFHTQSYAFGPDELAGLKIFFREKPAETAAGVGNCVACHQAPNFTDFNFHNTGATQKEYDGIHGDGSFAELRVPGLVRRYLQPNKFLPPTPLHPQATGRFKSIPSPDNKNTDLGLWNIFANPDFPKAQDKLFTAMCVKRVFDDPRIYQIVWEGRFESFINRVCRVRKLLPRTIALFKTPGLRDLGHSAPYMHNGQEDTLEDVVDFYVEMSDLARADVLRNGAFQLKDITLLPSDVPLVVKFLQALNEDYE